MNTDRGKRIRKIVVTVVVVTISMLLVGRYFYNIFDRKQEELYTDIMSVNKSMAMDHNRNLRELLDIATEVSAFKDQLSEGDIEKYLIKLEAIGDDDYMERLVFINQGGHNSNPYDYNELFEQSVGRVVRIINVGLYNEESYRYLSELEIVLELLNDDYWEGFREYNNFGYGDSTKREEKTFEDKRIIGFAEGDMFDSYFSASFQTFDSLRKYEGYFDALPWSDSSSYKEERMRHFELEEGTKMKDVLLPLLFGDSIIAIEEKSDEFIEMSETFDEYEWDIEVAYMDEKLEYNLRIDPYEKSIDIYLEDLEDYDIVPVLLKEDSLAQCLMEIERFTDEDYIVTDVDYKQDKFANVSVMLVKGNYYNQMHYISYGLTTSGILEEMTIRDAVTWFAEYNGEETINMDLSEERLLVELPEKMLEDYDSMKVIKDYHGLLIYEVKVENYENYLYYQLDYETFEFLDVKSKSIIDEDIR